jgi:hypothetical protein
MIEPRPVGPLEAVTRARQLLAAASNAATGYYLGTGNYHPVMVGGKWIDVPWTQTTDESGAVHIGSDCAGFALSWCYKLSRHRDGYNRGRWATVSDDINSNSAIEDADHDQDLFRRVAAPEPGDLLCYPTFRLDGHPRPWIGHVAIVLGTDRAGNWDPAAPQYHLLDIAQCCGGNDRKPAAIATDGSVFDKHDHDWNNPLRLAGMTDVEEKVSVKTVMLRALP